MKRIFSVYPSGLTITPVDTDRLLGVLEMFRSIVPTTKLSFVRQSNPGDEPRVFLYRIEAADGRIWKQHITFDNAGDPQMTFEVANPWRLSEFSNQRNVRNALVSIAAAYPSLEKIVYEYTDVA